MPNPPRPKHKTYDTRFDRFRAREGLSVLQWASAVGMNRTQLNDYRSGAAHPHAHTLAALVRAASRILGRAVKASELYDLGEGEQVAVRRQEFRAHRSVQKKFNSPLDRLLRRLDVPLTPLAAKAGVSRQAIRHLRMGTRDPVVPTIRALVGALRRMGYDVRASDIFDVGE